MPDAPSTITLRASAAVGPTRAIRRRPALTSARTHSAPLRVLPKPRPAISSHIRQDPAGGSGHRRQETVCRPCWPLGFEFWRKAEIRREAEQLAVALRDHCNLGTT